MNKLFLYFIFFFLFFNIEGNSEEISPVKYDYEEIFNVGKMISHDDKFTLYFFPVVDNALVSLGKQDPP